MTIIYLAGPDVFRSNAVEVLEAKRTLLKELGYRVLTPLDTDSDDPYYISRSNEIYIYGCDVVVADVQPFRGTEPDSGTVYEIGYARACGKDVITYNNPEGRNYTQRLKQYDFLKFYYDQPFKPEPFGLNQNLMISCSAQAELTSFEDVLEYLKTHYGKYCHD